ncbi:predicted protein [Phaeodactylum tricornutum CCAP 1055/1]|uniref:Uncharacterized protein n=1 Tax=Phaeodactylum tricornutum (strain CCAP 1055/1) TaxID=556484 RepID=B7S4F2_PHATC|nr:predicted protein [Phaeodactylum tricornutum CCAP 1055/1]EEC42569.1 predicted protein [Phaeodactylum tricornutum CCAP 1055/1]|eukprot:XP_002176446.1 predicted protein [Phaeodactylum tricornutum CCAP 1055/1]
MSNPTLIYSVMSKGQAPKLYTELTNVKGARVVNNYDGTNKEIGRLIETTLFIPKGTTLAFAVPKGVGVRVSRPILNADGSEGGTDRKIVKHQIDDEHYCIIVAEQDGTSTTSITSRSGVMYMLIHLEDAVPTIGVNNVLSLLGFYSSGSREESQHLFLEHNTDFLKLGTSLSDATNDLPVELWYNEVRRLLFCVLLLLLAVGLHFSTDGSKRNLLLFLSELATTILFIQSYAGFKNRRFNLCAQKIGKLVSDVSFILQLLAERSGTGLEVSAWALPMLRRKRAFMTRAIIDLTSVAGSLDESVLSTGLALTLLGVKVSGLCCAFDGDSSSDCNVVCNGVMSQDPIIVALGGGS